MSAIKTTNTTTTTASQPAATPTSAVSTEVQHFPIGLAYVLALEKGWKQIETTFTHNDSRLTGGAWLYKGDPRSL